MKKKPQFKSKFVCACLLFLLTIALLRFTPIVTATPTLQTETVTMVKDFGTANLNAITQTSNGTVIAGVDGDFYVSTDDGTTWTMTQNNTGTSNFLTMTSSMDYIFAANQTGMTCDIWKSADYGKSWTLVIDNSPKVWRLAELSNRTLLINTYADSGVNDLIYKSDDYGDTWSVFYNFTGYPDFSTHIHSVCVDPYTNDIWVATGDTTALILKWNATANDWIKVRVGTVNDLDTDILFDADWVYLIPDTDQDVLRLPKTAIDMTEAVVVYNTYSDDAVSGGYAYSMMGAVFDDGLMVIGTDYETVQATWDGDHWLKLFQSTYTGSGAWRIDYITKKRNTFGFWYFINDYNNKIYRASTTKEQVRTRWFTIFMDYYGSYNKENIVIPAADKGEYDFNLSTQDITQFKLSIVGAEIGNYIVNPSFETNTSHWTTNNYCAAQGRTTYQSNSGLYSYNVNKTKNDYAASWAMTTWNNDSFKQYDTAETIIFSCYYRANRSMTSMLKINIGYFFNGVFATVGTSTTVSPTTSWQRAVLAIPFPSGVTHQIGARISLLKSTSYNAAYYIDAIQLERKIIGGIDSEINDGNSIVLRPYTAPSVSTYSEGRTAQVHNVTVTPVGLPTITYIGLLPDEQSHDYVFSKTSSLFQIAVSINATGQCVLILTYEVPISASGKYVLDVYVQRDFIPALGTVNINSENKSTNLLGQTSWQLPYGTYDIIAYQGTDKQSVTLLLNGDTSKTFNFITPPSSRTSMIVPLVMLLGFGFLIFLFYPRLFRRRK